jgi:DNA-binding transcriptional ArsR family regulator
MSPSRPRQARGAERAAAAAAFAQSAPVFAALGDPTRLGLVARLCGDGPLSIVRLSEGAGVSRQAVTKHLEALSEAGLVRDRWHGRQRVFELEPARLALAQRHLEEISSQWDRALSRLQAFVEGDR